MRDGHWEQVPNDYLIDFKYVSKAFSGLLQQWLTVQEKGNVTLLSSGFLWTHFTDFTFFVKSGIFITCSWLHYWFRIHIVSLAVWTPFLILMSLFPFHQFKFAVSISFSQIMTIFFLARGICSEFRNDWYFKLYFTSIYAARKSCRWGLERYGNGSALC